MLQEQKESRRIQKVKKLFAKERQKFLEFKRVPVSVGSPSALDKANHSKVLAYLGFGISDSNGYYFSVQPPKGWKLFYPEGSLYWCYMLDEKGRKRAAIYFNVVGMADKKNILESSWINYMTRYRIMIDHEIPFNPFGAQIEGHFQSPFVAKIVDAETNVIIQHPGKYEFVNNYLTNPKEWALEERQARQKFYSELEPQLIEMYPEYQNILAYWND